MGKRLFSSCFFESRISSSLVLMSNLFKFPSGCCFTQPIIFETSSLIKSPQHIITFYISLLGVQIIVTKKLCNDFST